MELGPIIVIVVAMLGSSLSGVALGIRHGAQEAQRAIAQACADSSEARLTLNDARYRVPCSKPETLVQPWGN